MRIVAGGEAQRGWQTTNPSAFAGAQQNVRLRNAKILVFPMILRIIVMLRAFGGGASPLAGIEIKRTLKLAMPCLFLFDSSTVPTNDEAT
jgi:hypothetical protein